MQKIKVFESGKEIDLEKLIESRLLICANSGAGKSYTVRKILEESNGSVMSIVLDTEGEFKTLREEYDFLLIGPEGDVPLNRKVSHHLPKKLLEMNVPTIIDISELKRPERIKYVKEFIESLMELPKKYWKPILIFIDEVHQYCGQQEKQDSTWAVIDLATRGRKRGYGPVFCTQRISKFHKDAVAECNNYLVGRMSLDIDMKRASDILGFSTREDTRALRTLQNGEFYVFGPAISNDIDKEKVAKTKTTHIKTGVEGGELAKPNESIKKILKSLEELPEEAERELKEINDYKTEIARLKRELSKQPAQMKVKEVVRVDDKAIHTARMQERREVEKEARQQILQWQTNFKKAEKKLQEIGKILEKEIAVAMPTPQGKSPLQVKFENQTLKDVGLPLAARKIYSFLFENPEKKFTMHQVAFATGYAYGGGFMNNVYTLTNQGLAIKDGNTLQIGEIDSSIATEKIGKFNMENILRKLPKAAEAVLRVLYENNDQEYTPQELAEITGYAYGGGFMNNVYKLTGLKLAIKSGGQVRINKEVLEL